MAERTHLRVFCATWTILPAFCYVCGPGKVFLYSRTLHRQLESKVFWTPVDQHRPTELSHIRFHLYTWKRTCRHLSIRATHFEIVEFLHLIFEKFFFSKVRACFVFSTSRPDGRTRHQGLIFCLLFKNWKKNKNLLYCLRNHFQGVCENPWQLATSSRVIWDFLAASPRHESKLKFNKRSSPRKEKEKRYSSPWYCGDPLPTSPTSVDINWHSWTLPVFNTDCDLYYCVLVVWQLRISHLNSLFVFICALTLELSDRRSRESLEKKRKIGDDAYVFSRQDEWRRDGGVRWGRRDSRSCL